VPFHELPMEMLLDHRDAHGMLLYGEVLAHDGYLFFASGRRYAPSFRYSSVK
jgi:hypothetical protein